MEITFEPTEIFCKQPLSSQDSPWGSEDGIRLYFYIEVGTQALEFMQSGREFPQPDVVDNYLMKPGKQINLRNYPPVYRSSWRSKVFNINEGNLVTLTLIGVNEGLPYIAGGGGGFLGSAAGKLAKAAAESAAKKGAEEAAKLGLEVSATAVPIIGAAVGAVIDFAEYLNTTVDCYGTAFLYSKQYTGRDLISELIKSKGRASISFPKDSPSLRSGVGRECNTPDYELKLDINLKSKLEIKTNLSNTSDPVKGEEEDFSPLFKVCARGDQSIKVWAISTDQKIEFIPNFKFKGIDLIWTIEGQALNKANGSLNLPVNTIKQPNNKDEIDFDKKLTIFTKGVDGSYTLRVKALLELYSNEPAFTIYSNFVSVEGQVMEGDENYARYLACVAGLLAKIRRVVWTKSNLLPGEPIERVKDNLIRYGNIEQSLQEVVNLVEKINESRNG
jgi:hypothetical protein